MFLRNGRSGRASGVGSTAVALMMLVIHGIALADRPLTIDDAEPVEKGKWQVELGATYTSDRGDSHFDFPVGLSYGLFDRMELGIGLGWQYDQAAEVEGGHSHEHGINDVVLGAKWKVLDHPQWFFDHAIVPQVKFPTASRDHGLGSGHTEFDLTWIGTRQLFENLGLDLNIGYTWTADTAGSDVFHYGVALRWQMNKHLEPVAEVFAEKNVEEGTRTAVFLNVGIRWIINEHLTLDAGVGTELYGDAPHLVGQLGLTICF